MLTLGALSFAEPLILISLLALPAIWLLLRTTPPAPQRVKFPAFIILRNLAGTEETPDKTPWWVLLLRLLVPESPRWLIIHGREDEAERVVGGIEDKVRGGLALPDAIERVAFPDFVPPEPGAPDFAEGELAEAAE